MILCPNSASTAELGEVGWTAAARAAAVAARRMKARYPDRDKKGARPANDDEGGSAAGGGGKASARPKKSGETQNDDGERVITYGDGSTVTVHADGTATHTDPQGGQRKGVYKDPQPKKRNTDPEGFSTPKPKKAAPPRNTKKRKDKPKAKAAKREQLRRVALSRTKKGPMAGTGEIYR